MTAPDSPAPPVSPGVADLVARLRVWGQRNGKPINVGDLNDMSREAADLIEALAAGQREAVEAEREACAKVAELDGFSGDRHRGAKQTANEIADAIRARGGAT
jgi:hypothetical protein